MRMIFRTLLFLLCMALPAAAASQRVTATVVVTNTPVFNNTIVVNGNTRTWTNAITSSPSSLLLIGADRLISATNLWNGIAATPFAGPVAASFNSGSNIVLVGQVDESMAVTFSGTWGRVSYSTQVVSSAYAVRVPVASEPLASFRTNVASDLINAFNVYGTNALLQSSIVGTNFVGMTNIQTIAQSATKTWLNTNAFTNSSWQGGTLTNPVVGGLRGLITNSFVLGSYLTNGFMTGFNLGSLTNGVATNLTLLQPVMTNSVNHGDPFRSHGSGALSEQYGTNADASGESSLAVGANTTSSGLNSVAVGAASAASGDFAVSILGATTMPNSVAIGNQATVGGGLSATNGIAIGNQSVVSADFSVAIGDGAQAQHIYAASMGYGAHTTKSNQVMLGGTGIDTYVQNVLQVAGAITNSTFTGTNVWKGQLSFLSAARTSLANGNNSGIVLGTNVYVRLSGASTVANIAGFAAEPDGSWHIVQITGSITNNILTESGVDAVAANRIVTGTGGTVIMTNSPSMLEIIYDATAARWRIMKASN